MRLRRPYGPLVVLIVKENSGRKLRWAAGGSSGGPRAATQLPLAPSIPRFRAEGVLPTAPGPTRVAPQAMKVLWNTSYGHHLACNILSRALNGAC